MSLIAATNRYLFLFVLIQGRTYEEKLAEAGMNTLKARTLHAIDNANTSQWFEMGQPPANALVENPRLTWNSGGTLNETRTKSILG